MITPAQHIEMLARIHKNNPSVKRPDAVSVESDLHESISSYCRTKGFYVVHSRMDQKSTTAKGTPDFIIALPLGRTVWIECKTKIGKQTTEQKGAEIILKLNGHEYHLVRSMAEFLEKVFPIQPKDLKDEER